MKPGKTRESNDLRHAAAKLLNIAQSSDEFLASCLDLEVTAVEKRLIVGTVQFGSAEPFFQAYALLSER
jgi:hypothetical protein